MIIRLSIPFQLIPIISNYIQLTSSISKTHDTSMSWLHLHQNSAKRQGRGNTSYLMTWFAGLIGIARTRINGDHIILHINPTNGPYLILLTLPYALFSSVLFPQRKKSLAAKSAIARDLSRHGTWLLQNLKVSRSWTILQLLRAFVILCVPVGKYVLQAILRVMVWKCLWATL